MVYSGIIFFIKMGIAIGGALAGWLLAFSGYQADIPQTESTKLGLLISFTVLPALGSIAVAWIMRKYTLTEEKVIKIQAELTQTDFNKNKQNTVAS
jgi:GPH family glycoside/pentoside/hexuronide:cation symporter